MQCDVLLAVTELCFVHCMIGCPSRHIACAEGAYSVAHWLLDLGVDPNPHEVGMTGRATRGDQSQPFSIRPRCKV